MNNKLTDTHVSRFETIRHINENDEEYWHARDLQEILGYTEWRNFILVIEKAKLACKKSRNVVAEHFVDVNKMVHVGSGAEREVADYDYLL